MKTKVIIALSVLVILLGSGLVIGFIEHGKAQGKAEAAKEQLLEDLSEQKELVKGLIRSSSEQVKEADLRRVVKEEMSGIEDDLDGLGARLVSVSRATGRLEASVSKIGTSDSSSTVEGLPEHTKSITWTSKNGHEGPLMAWARVKPVSDVSSLSGRLRTVLGVNSDKATAEVLAYLSNPEAVEWETGTFPLEFHLTAAEADAGDDVRTSYVQLYVSEPGGANRIPLVVLDADFMYVEPNAPSFRFFDPHIDGGITGAILPFKATGGTIGISFMSYGVSSQDHNWRFVRAGLGYDGEQGWLEVSPAGWNFGSRIPLISDAWIYPSVVISSVRYGGAISTVSTW